MSIRYEDDPDFASPPPKAKAGGFRWIELLVVVGIIGLLIGLILPASRGTGSSGRRSMCVNNLKQIALALYQYEKTYQALPPAYTVDAQGKPMHSWRTLILPFLEETALYNSIDLTKPWDDPANAEARKKAPHSYRCPAWDNPPDTTTYLANADPRGVFIPGKPRNLSEIVDDPSLTVLVFEADESQSVPWMAPHDADVASLLRISPSSSLPHPGGFNAGNADGSVSFMKATTPASIRVARMTIAGQDDKVAREH